MTLLIRLAFESAASTMPAIRVTAHVSLKSITMRQLALSCTFNTLCCKNAVPTRNPCCTEHWPALLHDPHVRF